MSKKMKVLFLEDTQLWEDTYKAFFRYFYDNVEITHFRDGHPALLELEKVKFDLILCDHYMPRTNGDRVYGFTRCKVHSLNKETPFMHFSSMPCPGEYEGSFKDDNFYWNLKNGDIYDLYHDLRDLGFEPIKECSENSKQFYSDQIRRGLCN